MVPVLKRASFNVPYAAVNLATTAQQTASLCGVIVSVVAPRMERRLKWVGGIRPLLWPSCSDNAQPIGLQLKQVLRSSSSGED